MSDDKIPLTQEQIRSLVKEAERHQGEGERPLTDKLLAGETLVLEITESSAKWPMRH